MPPEGSITSTASEPPVRSGAVGPVILSGGSGTRLWPVSRESFPKQFWPLVSERTMIQETASRGAGSSGGRASWSAASRAWERTPTGTAWSG